MTVKCVLNLFLGAALLLAQALLQQVSALTLDGTQTELELDTVIESESELDKDMEFDSSITSTEAQRHALIESMILGEGGAALRAVQANPGAYISEKQALLSIRVPNVLREEKAFIQSGAATEAASASSMSSGAELLSKREAL